MICHRRFGKWFCNGLLLVIAVIVLSLCLLNLVNPYLPAIRCQGKVVVDAGILHKYAGDTVRVSYLLTVVFLAPLIQILTIEVIHFHIRYSCGGPLSQNGWKTGLPFVVKWFRDYVYGTIFLVLFNDICKSILNSPRPHFVDSCRPNFTEGHCINGWVEDYNCTNVNISQWKLADSHKSFPSAHAALGMYSAIFMILFQHHRLSVKRHGAILILWCNVCWLGWGIFCSLSRVADFRHHPVDIIAGGLIGIIGAIFAVHFLSNNFRFAERHQLDIYEEQGIYPPPCNRTINGEATLIQGLTTQPNMQTSVSMPAELNGSIPSTKVPGSRVLANTPQRPSLRRLLSSQSTLTQMTDIREDRELEPI